jgi:hypothetical protein
MLRSAKRTVTLSAMASNPGMRMPFDDASFGVSDSGSESDSEATNSSEAESESSEVAEVSETKPKE